MPNRLAQETSPYLRQHADNPVDWHAWTEEALERARRENKPILLSVGYSACHWCHVMAHESFEDPDVAEVMNRLFVNIKVDREERPDLDHIYQLVHQMMTHRPGGWPLTVFLSPDQVPFFAGTYFPKEPRFNLPGFAELCERAANAWQEHQGEITGQRDKIVEALARSQGTEQPTDAGFTAEPIEQALDGLKQSFDARNGGFGAAPKFPHPIELELCLRRHAASGDREALNMVSHTLDRMALGGLFDQLGGGFARYSVDAGWVIPHFEKMLYDNGPLLRLYADAWCLTRSDLYLRVAHETAGWMLREMRSPEGAFYSSLDADSEHEEGKFYVWDRDLIRGLLSAGEYAVAALHYGLDAAPNFEGRHWHLNVARPVEEVAARLGRDPREAASQLASARQKLLAAREHRVHPGRDDKVLTSWNALAIAGLARAGAVFDRPEWIAAARTAFAFLHDHVWEDGILRATWKEGRARHNAYLDDHAFLLAAAIELAQAVFEPDVLAFARTLGDALLERFEDRDAGGFYFTSHDHERLIARMKPFHDAATPSGNGVAAHALLRLSYLTGDARYAQASERTLRAFWNGICEVPGSSASLLMALEESLVPTRTVILRGPRQSVEDWRRKLASVYLPTTLTMGVSNGAAPLPEVLAKPASQQVNAWVCEGVTCLPPLSEFQQLTALVSKTHENV